MTEDNVLDREIENWRGFASVMYEQDREMFARMMSEAKAYAKSAKTAPTKDPAEALIMTLIFQQQKMISRLVETHAKLNHALALVTTNLTILPPTSQLKSQPNENIIK